MEGERALTRKNKKTKKQTASKGVIHKTMQDSDDLITETVIICQ